MRCLRKALVCVLESTKVQRSTAAGFCHQQPRCCKKQPDDLVWLQMPVSGDSAIKKVGRPLRGQWKK